MGDEENTPLVIYFTIYNPEEEEEGGDEKGKVVITISITVGGIVVVRLRIEIKSYDQQH